MFERGLPQECIADLCRVNVRRVRREVQKELQRDPCFLDRCLILHDQPIYRKPPVFAAPTAAERWAQNYVATAEYVLRTGSLPSQNAGAEGRALYKWLQYQRLRNDAGKLEEKRGEALDKLGSWQGTHRDNLDGYWARRLQGGHCLPRRAWVPSLLRWRQGPTERQLAVWLPSANTPVGCSPCVHRVGIPGIHTA
jgi:hypothetical protein